MGGVKGGSHEYILQLPVPIVFQIVDGAPLHHYRRQGGGTSPCLRAALYHRYLKGWEIKYVAAGKRWSHPLGTMVRYKDTLIKSLLVRSKAYIAIDH